MKLKVSRIEKIEKAQPNVKVLRDLENKKVKVICKIDGNIWEARPYDLCRGIGCAECAGNKRYTTETFKEKMKDFHPNLLVLGEYKNTTTKIKVKCLKCGDICSKKPQNLLIKKGCLKCWHDRVGETNRITDQQFKKRVKEYFNGEFIVLGEFKGNEFPINIKHKICGSIFETFGRRILYKEKINPCPNCFVRSHGELIVQKELQKNKIFYEKEKTFNDLKLNNKLRFDFYLKELNACIEYDGEQHFKPVKLFGGEDGYLKLKKCDKMKNDYCEDKGIKLLRIPYYEKDIEGTIKRFIEEVQK